MIAGPPEEIVNPTTVRSEATAERSADADARSNYRSHDDGIFEFVDYSNLPVFCSFLPGIAGPGGTPLWAMYVNRGQGVVSFGVRDKDHAIAEFFPATWAWQLAALNGFRTFVRAGGGFWEPFAHDAGSPSRRMLVERHALRIEDADEATGLSISVEYCTSAETPTAALLRTVRLRNGGRRACDVELLDGLPAVVPAGVSDFSMKKQRRITEAFCRVRFDGHGTALFAPPASMADAADVAEVREATFYAARGSVGGSRGTLPLVVDPDRVFGSGNDFVRPRAFIADDAFDPEPQMLCNRLPCAFAHCRARLAPGEEIRIDALAGHARSPAAAAAFVAVHGDAVDALRSAARRVVDEVVAPALSATALRELDGHVLQNHLDNVLRGGRPVMLPSRSGPVPLHLYARRHGDLERDYNDFHLPPWPLSEGPGNYRDVLQNRRNDVWFHPEIGDAEIRAFVELLQADGYNPLAVEGYRWRLPAGAKIDGPLPAGAEGDSLRRLLGRPFSPGELLRWASEHGIDEPARDAWSRRLLAQCDATLHGSTGHDGYWIDHWTYLVDMLEAFEAVHPEKLETTLFASAMQWFPAASGLVPVEGTHPRRYRLERLQHPAVLPASCLFARLCALAAIKVLTLDAEGRGIEMEANRPGWNDAMNGLPGLGGSSTCEAAELLRLCRWLLERTAGMPDRIALPAIVARMVEQARSIAAAPWNHGDAVAAREDFRKALYAGEGTAAVDVASAGLVAMLASAERLCADGIDRSAAADGALVHTYFMRDDAGQVRPLPLFLEGQVHRLRLREGRQKARAVHAAVRSSNLHDRQLGMYRLNESLADFPHGIGRARTFTPGVYENESIWLHMSMKYLVELLRCGLHDEFFRDAQTMLVPFMDPSIYGRSIYESCSFIAASCCPEPAIRGRGFVARLTGSTAEFIHIWRLLTVGERPFRLERGELVFRPEPVLPADWFRSDPSTLRLGAIHHDLPADCLACTLPGGTLLVYRNAHRTNTWGDGAARPATFAIAGGEELAGSELRGDVAERLRDGHFRRIDVTLST